MIKNLDSFHTIDLSSALDSLGYCTASWTRTGKKRLLRQLMETNYNQVVTALFNQILTEEKS